MAFPIPGAPLINMIPGLASIADPSSIPEPTSPKETTARTWVPFNPENWDSTAPYYLNISSLSPIGDSYVPGDDFNSTDGSQFVFDIAPSSVDINIPFATSLVATNGGALVEHNGIVFKTIRITGTTGVYFKRDTVVKAPNAAGAAANIASTLFPSTIGAISNVVSAAKSTLTAITGGAKANPLQAEFDPSLTGYSKAWALHNLFATYSETKKLKPGNVMIFGSSKDNVEYVCIPVSFDIRRDASNPLLYKYDITLRSWAVNQASSLPPITVPLPSPKSVNLIKQLSNIIVASRNTIDKARNTIKAVNSDFANMMQVYSQCCLFIKDLVGIRTDISDFKYYFQNNYRDLVKGANHDIFHKALKDASLAGNVDASRALYITGKDSSAPQDGSSVVAGIASLSGLVGVLKTQSGADKTQESNSFDTQSQAQSVSTVLNDSDISSQVSMDSISFSKETSEGLQKENETIAAITANIVRGLNAQLGETSDNYAATVGGVDALYASTYGISVPSVERAPTEEDILTMVAIEESRTQFIASLASGEIFKEKELDPFVTANQGLPSNDQMSSPQSGILYKVRQDENLQDIARLTLGDANRWREIAAFNGLRAPYINELGFNLAVASFGDLSFTVTDRSSLFINQQIVISATGLPSSRRRIINIESLGTDIYRVTVDGSSSLSIYTGSGASLNARLAGTIGSGDAILIPTTAASDLDQGFTPRQTPLLNRLTEAEKIFRIDIGLGASGDITIGPGGDIGRVYGYDNAIQAIRLALEIEQGELEDHLSYGTPLPLGQATNTISTAQVGQIIKNTITKDPRFGDASVTIVNENNTVRVDVIAFEKAGNALIPVSFQIGVA